jgi:Ca2+:H+ antiporter
MVKSTKHLAEGVGSGIGGFLNATVGIAAELIIAGIALQMGLHSVIRASIPGSFIGNVLLVLGLNILAGGFKSPHQKFKRIAAR